MMDSHAVDHDNAVDRIRQATISVTQRLWCNNYEVSYSRHEKFNLLHAWQVKSLLLHSPSAEQVPNEVPTRLHRHILVPQTLAGTHCPL